MQRTAPAAPSLTLPRPLTGGAVCAALMAATAWAVLSGGWADNAGGAVVVAVAAAVEGTLLARAAVHRVVAIVVAPFLALAAIVPTTIGAMPFDGDPTARHTVGRYASALFTGLGSTGNWEFTVGLCAVLWICGYWLAWMALRERRAVLAVLPVYAVLATNVINTKVPDQVGPAEAIAVLCTLLVLAGSHLEAMQSRWHAGHVLALPGTRGRFAVTVAVAAAAITVVAMALPAATTTDISGRFFSGNKPGGATGGGGSGGAGAPIQFSTSTQPGGPLVNHPSPVLMYTTTSSAPVYLRVIDDTEFSDGDWYPAAPGIYTPVPAAQGTVGYPGGPIPRDRSPGDGAIGSSETTVNVSIRFQTTNSAITSLVPFPGEPDWSNMVGSIDGELPYSPQSGEGFTPLTVDSVSVADPAAPTRTTVKSRGFVPTPTAAQLRAAGSDYPSWTDPFVLLGNDSDPNLTPIRTLARSWTAGTHNEYDAAGAIEAHLRDPRYFTYTLRPPQPPDGQWAITYFLSTSHTGYCQYFASAMGTMLRSLDIPTRLVSGYGPGTTLSERDRSGNLQQLVTSSDAHVWVEAYFPTYGWIPFEPTPPSSAGNYTPFARGNVAASPPPATAPAPQATAPGKPGFANGDLPGGSTPAGSRASHTGTVLLGVAGGVALAVLLAVLWLLLPRSLRGTWRRVEVVGMLLGMRRHMEETHIEYARRLDDALRGRLGGDIALIARELGRAEFSGDGVERARVRRVHALWRRVLARALAAWAVRVGRWRPALRPA